MAQEAEYPEVMMIVHIGIELPLDMIDGLKNDEIMRLVREAVEGGGGRITRIDQKRPDVRYWNDGEVAETFECEAGNQLGVTAKHDVGLQFYRGVTIFGPAKINMCKNCARLYAEHHTLIHYVRQVGGMWKRVN